MYLLYDQALITRSSRGILFFKINEESGKWEQYHIFKELRGQIFYIRSALPGNVQIQVTTENRIYFYEIDKKTL